MYWVSSRRRWRAVSNWSEEFSVFLGGGGLEFDPPSGGRMYSVANIHLAERFRNGCEELSSFS